MIKAFYSDPHLGHFNIIEYCNRPFSTVEEMNEVLVRNYNNLISDNDIVFWLGDCFFKGNIDRYKALLGQMHGKKILIVGNHDQGDGMMARMGFEIVMHESVMEIGGRVCRLSHYPYDGPARDKHLAKRPRRNVGEILLHGHSHSVEKVTSRNSISVGVDAWGYGPALYSEVEELVKGI